MMSMPRETREQRKQHTRRALADVVRTRMAARRLRQTRVAKESGISRTFIQSLLRAEKGCSLFVFLELSHAVAADPSELLREVLAGRDAYSDSGSAATIGDVRH